MKKLANRFALCVLASLVVAAVLAATAAAQTTDDDVIRINTELVVIDAQVLDKKTVGESALETSIQVETIIKLIDAI